MPIMLDIETLSTRNNALVLSIGAVKFDLTPEKPIFTEKKLWTPDIVGQLLIRHVDPETQKWWTQQDPEARLHWKAPTVERQPVGVVLNELGNFVCLPVVSTEIWANGIVFDFGILESLYAEYNRLPPWKYNAARDCRTVYALLPEVRERTEAARVGTAHDPVYDCVEQIWKLWEKWPFPGVIPVAIPK